MTANAIHEIVKGNSLALSVQPRGIPLLAAGSTKNQALTIVSGKTEQEYSI